MIDHVAQRRRHDTSSLAQCRLHAVKQLGDHVLVESGQRHPAAAVTQAGRSGTAEPSKIRPAGQPPGTVMGCAQTAVAAGGEPLTGRHRAVAQARTRRGRRKGVIAADVGPNALASMAALPVAAQAQVVGPNRSFESGDPADQATPIPRPVRPGRTPLAEHVDVGHAAGLEAIAAAGAQTTRIPRLQLAAGDTADRVAEQRVFPVRRQDLRRGLPPGADEHRVVDRSG
jgi:hypothetical protein